METVRKLINRMSMKSKRLVDDIIIAAEPQDLMMPKFTAVGVYHKSALFVAIKGGKSFKVYSLADLLLKLSEIFQCFNCQCPKEASSFFNFLAVIRGANSDKPLSRMQKILLS